MVVALGLSCFAACGIFLDQGSNLCPLHWQVDSSVPPGKYPPFFSVLCRTSSVSGESGDLALFLTLGGMQS